MINYNIKQDKPFILSLIFVIFSLLLQENLNKSIFFLFGIITWLYSYRIYYKKNKDTALFKIFILSIPLSYVNIFNSAYSDLPLSWYNLFFFFIIIKFILFFYKNGDFTLNKISIYAILILILGLITLIISYDFIDGLKQYVNISTSFILLIVANTFKRKMSEKDTNELIATYVRSCLIAAIGLYVQYISINAFDNNIGNYMILGGNRETYAFLFSDFSFLSLYLVSGAIMFISQKSITNSSNYKVVIVSSILLIASIITSARTGLAAFLFVLVLSSIIYSLKNTLKGSIKGILIIFLNILVVLGSYGLLKKIRPMDMFSDSGRGIINELAMNAFMRYPILGVGLGIHSYSLNFGTIPHNMGFQLLAQGGLLLSLPIIFFLVNIIIVLYKRKSSLLLTFLVIIVGSFFIPDIFNSRFFAATFLIIGVENTKNIMN